MTLFTTWLTSYKLFLTFATKRFTIKNSFNFAVQERTDKDANLRRASFYADALFTKATLDEIPLRKRA